MCAVLASVIVCGVVVASDYKEFSQSISSWFLFVRGAVIVVTIAWIVTLPLVLLINRCDGWRFWILAFSGTFTGPALLIVLNLSIRFAEPSQRFDIVEGWKVESVVTAISLLATALYLGTLRFSTRSRAL